MKYVTFSTATEIKGNDYFDLILQQFIETFRHTGIHSLGYFLSSKLYQSIAMEKEGIIIVSSRKHKTYQKYLDTLE